MSSTDRTPLVSVVTPVYNGGKYLAECIESIVAQTYGNWEYTIVNNCSTDDSLEIAESYQKKDPRITVITNDHFVSAIDNHNIAFRTISDRSTYCKLVSADDWLYPQCLATLVEAAESDPSVSIVQGYVVNSNGVRWPGLPPGTSVFGGREIGRLYLLGAMEFAGIPSSNLFRSSFVRSSDRFFPGSRPSADAAACLNCLQHGDFALVHQIVSFERIHNEAVTAAVREMDSYLLDRIELLLQYGPIFLTQNESSAQLKKMLHYYYGVLAKSLLTFRGAEYRGYHKQRLAELQFGFYGPELYRALLSQLLDTLFNPKHTVEKALKRLFRSKSPRQTSTVATPQLDGSEQSSSCQPS